MMKYEKKKLKLLDCEPYFVIRAKDNYSVAVLKLLQNIYSIDDETIMRFKRWRQMNFEKCKDPD